MKQALGYFVFLTISALVTAGTALADTVVTTAPATGNGGLIAIAAGLGMGLAAAGCGLGQGKAVGSALESVGRNPSAAGSILTPMLVGLALIEGLAILTFVIAIFLQGKI